MKKSEIPNVSWSLEKLATTINTGWKRMAIDGWVMGTALNAAEEKLLKEYGYGKWQSEDGRHKGFVGWMKANVPDISTSAAYRYMDLADRVEDPDELYGLRIGEALSQAGLLPKDNEKKLTKTKKNKNGVTIAKGTGDDEASEEELAPPKDLTEMVRTLAVCDDETPHDLTLAELDEAIATLRAIRQRMKKKKAA